VSRGATWRVLFGAALLVLSLQAGVCAPAWHTDLAYPGGGYWSARVAVTVTNPGDAELLGAPVRVVVGKEAGQADFVGLPAQSVRVVKDTGDELLHEVTGVDGTARRTGALQAGDVITLPVEAPAGESAGLYIYAGNEAAWAPPDYFGGDFGNGGFETGDREPAGWTPAAVDSSHRMVWQEGGAHSGARCARCEVDEGAEATWVKYMQGPIPVLAGQQCRFTGWVKAENVKGPAGWYIHVDGDRPQMVNMSQVWEGTFDWRPSVIEFTVPQGGQLFSCGTFLHGTGVAWFDDATFEVVGGAETKVTVGATERRELRRIEGAKGWASGEEWFWRTPGILRNFEDAPARRALVTIDAYRPRTLLARYAGWRYELPLRILDPENLGEPLPYAWADGKVMTVTSIPARSEKVLDVYWSPEKEPAGAGRVVDLADWCATDLNLAANGDMDEPDGATAAGWPSSEEGREPDPARFSVRRVKGGVHGDWCLQLSVPLDLKEVGWVGSRQRVPVKPNTQYLLSGYVKGQGLMGEGRIHGHLRKEDGSLCASGAFFGTSPTVSGDSDWALTSVTVTTPGDCAFIEIHLTMNCTGTLMHDAVLLAEARSGDSGPVEADAVMAEGAGLSAWTVEPMVKVFPDDWPADGKANVHIYAGRNEYEPFQLALRSAAGGPVQVRASELKGPGGATLSAPETYRVDYVPVDFPIGYASSEQPGYYRIRPRYRGCDGWAGEWPDPMVPIGDGRLEIQAGRTQPLWFDVYVPKDARPGDYTGTVELRFAGQTQRVPVKLTVWPFVLADRKKTQAIYDLRRRGGWDIFAGGEEEEMIETWSRFLDRYNVSPGLIYPTPEFSYENGKLTMDFTGFDRTCSLLFDELNCNVAYTPWFLYAFGWAYPPKKLFGTEPFTPEWNAIFQGGLKQFYDHCRERGWDKYFAYYASDEPDRTSEEVHNNLNQVCDLAREAVPGVLVYSSTWSHLPRLDGHLNLWGIGPQGTFPWEEVEERRKAGDRFWFTTDGQMCLDTPYLAIERLLPWMCFAYDVEAYEFWGVSWWTYDPWKYGWHSYIRQSHEGEVYRWVRYPNGDGFLTYPGQPVGRKGPLASIRLAAAREGIEDREIFSALAEKADSSPACRKALDRVRELVQIPNKGGRYSTSLMPNPEAVMQARVAAGEALARMTGGR